MSRQQLSNLDFNGEARIVNLPNPVGAQDAATKIYVDNAVEGLAWKDSVRVSTDSNTNLAAPGSSIDGVTMVINDRVLFRGQTAPEENGIYIYNGDATPATRSLDANTFEELESAVVTVEEGTSAGATFRQSEVGGTLETDPITWTDFGTVVPDATETTKGKIEIATQPETDAGSDNLRAVTPQKLANYSGRAKRFAQAFGDGSATQYTITHNLGTRDVQVAVYRNSGNYDEVGCDMEHATENSVTVRFAVAPASNAFRCVVIA